MTQNWFGHTLAVAGSAALIVGAIHAAARDAQPAAAKTTPMSAGSKALHQTMEKGHKDMMQMKMTGDTDHDFAMMMIKHHQGAIDMSEAVLAHGSDPKIKDMARKIVDAQKKEIAEFQAWMKEHAPAAAHKH